MKKLQSNFTTHEQSKRLLELGVPADSADCVYDAQGRVYIKPHEYIFKDCPTLLPCWSAGRLIEIMCINDLYFDYGGCSYRRGYNMIDYIISQLEAEDNLEFSESEE